MTGEESPYLRDNRSPRLDNWRQKSPKDERAEMAALAETYWRNEKSETTDSEREMQ